ncbi:MAG TPA: GNAT family N-acetyltransferase [Vicinamibacterales bacterium]|nr:GNAT family N-acetyltransferase [Vicinamibacterales bacterium]
MVRLRRTAPADLAFILPLEHHPDNRDLIGQWTCEEHLVTMARSDREHWTMVNEQETPLGYLIAYDSRTDGYGIYIKRIAVAERSRGVGRVALAAFLDHIWRDSDADLVTLAVRGHNARAIHVYEIVGFETWALTPGQRAAMTELVDPIPDDCLVMRAWRPADAG